MSQLPSVVGCPEGQINGVDVAKTLRLAAMVASLHEELTRRGHDERGRREAESIYRRCLDAMPDAVGDPLAQELFALLPPLAPSPSDSDLQLVQAQLDGWLQGLVRGFRFARWTQHVPLDTSGGGEDAGEAAPERTHEIS